MNHRFCFYPLCLIVCLSVCCSAKETFKNPIIPGFHPDPSLCRVGDDYYLVNSSFEWFPGLPIRKSKNLVNWELIGHAIKRPKQLGDLNLWAPTIRFHEGLFYIICTERPGHVFYVTATDPAGDWSDPVYIDIDPSNVSAIDPSLFWDDDGTCWFAANDRKLSGNIKHWVWIQKIDLQAVQRNGRDEATLIGERRYITKGSGVGPDNYAEGPHIFKYDGLYYLLIAEGGTWDKHAMSVLRTASLEAPLKDWEYNPNNPILTHRDKESPISATGHADFVATQHGEWWSAHLGVRKQDGKHKLGRETFLVPIVWEQDATGKYWPVYNPDQGQMSLMVDQRPDLPWTPVNQVPAKDDFLEDELAFVWNTYHLPETLDWYQLNKGFLELKYGIKPPTFKGNSSFIGRRQQHHNFDASLAICVPDDVEKNERAGLIATINNRHQIRLEVGVERQQVIAKLIYVSGGQSEVVGMLSLPVSENCDYILKLEARGWDFRFFIGPNENELRAIGDIQDARILSSEIAKGFTGSYVGMFASANGQPSDKVVKFDWFEYQPNPSGMVED